MCSVSVLLLYKLVEKSVPVSRLRQRKPADIVNHGVQNYYERRIYFDIGSLRIYLLCYDTLRTDVTIVGR